MNKESKPIQVTRSSLPDFQEYCDEIKSIWDTRWLTNNGPKYQKLAESLKKYLKVQNIQMFSNGHMALELAIKALGLTGQIITTPFTFASTTQAIVNCGLTPVFCDVEEKYYTMDPEKIEALITPETSAIIPVHVYGNICDYKAIEKIAEKHNLKVIYDAAHAFGIQVDSMGAGSLGDITMFSFHATKTFNTVEGGCLTFPDEKLNKELSALRQFGMYGKEDAEIIGTNAKLTEFHAAMGICNLRNIDEYIADRENCFKRYRERLGNIEGIVLPPVQRYVKSNYSYFPVLFDKKAFGLNRDEVSAALEQHNIFARKYFYPLTSDFSAIKERFTVQPTPIASRIAGRVLTLPLYSDLTAEEVDRICDIILACRKKLI